MHTCREVQTAAVTIISYKPLSDLNFARHTGQLHALSPFGVYKPLILFSPLTSR